ncbi:pyruvate dehydrogenase E1 component subunit alpha (ODPA) [Vairimorpha necatrix]|uniref:Pyruvate dehydrogenase E1 component subunit alpha, mitochondrial n=1 Tax=Vairimorpha necatrix TaxID=6039 RepID=A0AAX4JG84_9MICR
MEYHLIEENDIKFDFKLDKKSALEIYKNMLSLRILEEYAEAKYKIGSVRGFCHLVIGQENIYMSLQKILNKNDKVIGSYRCHGLAYVCGISVEGIIGELLGKEIGICKGKGGSMHLYNKQFYGGHGIVGAQVALGTGLAYALQYKKMDNVAFVFYGDGAANQGQVWESFNMASLWKLPVVYICENNKYGMWTPENVVTSYTEYYKRGYDIPGIRIRDTDICKLINVLKYARKHALDKGPIILQIDTYRTCGHSCADVDDFYRSKEEKEERMNNDCLNKFKEILGEYVNNEEIADVDHEVIKNFEKCVEKVAFSEEPCESELYKDVLN